MIELQPKTHFLSHEAIKNELAKVVAADNFQFCLGFALAEFVSKTTPNADQLAAVRAFIHTLVNLPFKDESLPSFQTRTLDHSQYLPPKPQTSTKS